jgi:serine/threonine protein kinase
LDPVETTELVQMSAQAASGVQYLHEKRIIHRDLSARNCLVFLQETASGTPPTDGAAVTIIKIADFGFSQCLSETVNVYMLESEVVLKLIPVKWSAPEVLAQRRFVFASDVWSFGILLWEIFSCGDKPYGSMDNAAAKEAVGDKGYRLDPPERTPPIVVQAMQMCWQFSEDARPTMVDVCSTLTVANSNVGVASPAGVLLMVKTILSAGVAEACKLIRCAAAANTSTRQVNDSASKNPVDAISLIVQRSISEAVLEACRTKAGTFSRTCAANQSGILAQLAANGHVDAVIALLEANADPSATTTDNGETPVYAAASKGHADVLALLLEANADPSAARAVDGATYQCRCSHNTSCKNRFHHQ